MTQLDQISSQNLSSQNEHEQLDYFSGIFQNRLSKWISIMFSILGSIFAIFMIYSIIWFERYGLKVRKTLINRLFISADYIGIVWLSLFQQLDVLRYLYGPLPQLVCHFTDYSKFALTNQIFTTFAFIMITRYLFIFYLKNPAGFYDEFWYKFILAWIIMFSWISQIPVYLGPGKHFPNFYICAGLSPVPDETQGEKNYAFNSSVRMCSVFIQMVIAIRIKYYKWKTIIVSEYRFGRYLTCKLNKVFLNLSFITNIHKSFNEFFIKCNSCNVRIEYIHWSKSTFIQRYITFSRCVKIIIIDLYRSIFNLFYIFRCSSCKLNHEQILIVYQSYFFINSTK